MKRKLLILVLALAVLALGLASCTHVHTPGEWIVDAEATCGAEGSRHSSCVLCGTQITEKIPATEEHNPVTDARVEPTETEDGLTEGSHCADCGKVIVKQEIIPALGVTTDTSITSATLEKTESNLTGTVSSATESFSFLNDVTVAEGAEYTVYSDEALTVTVDKANAPLTYGNNIFYIVVKSGNDETVYTVTIKRLNTFTLTFDTAGGSAVDSMTVEEGEIVTAPVTTRPGYTFLGWDYDFTAPIAEALTVTASWQANTDTAYTVEIYTELLDGSFAKTSDLKQGTTDTEVAVVPEEKAHFTYRSEGSVLSGNITADGGLILKVYYTRNSYTVTTTTNNAEWGSVTEGGSYPYETEITLTATAGVGYKLLGWYKDGNPLGTDATYTVKVEESISIEARFEAITDIPYTVEIYTENLTGGFDLTTEGGTGSVNELISITPEEKAHFTYRSEGSVLSGNITADGGLTLKVYYTRNSYTVTTETDNAEWGSVTEGGSYPYETEITLTATAESGYIFTGWYNGSKLVSSAKVYTHKVNETITLTAKFARNDNVSYVIEYYYQNETGDGYKRVLEAKYGAEGESVTANTPAKDGFTVDTKSSVLTGVIAADGSLVLKVYYMRNNYSAVIVNKGDKKGAITFIFDDGVEDSASRVVALGEKYTHVTASFAVIVNKLVTMQKTADGSAYLMDENGRYVYTENTAVCNFWRDVISSPRYEIVSHTYSHAYAGADENDANYPKGHMMMELAGSNQVIQDLGSSGYGFIWAGTSPANTEYFRELMEACGIFIANRNTDFSWVGSEARLLPMLTTPEKLATTEGRFSIIGNKLEHYGTDNTNQGTAVDRETCLNASIVYWTNFIDLAMREGAWGVYCIHDVVADDSDRTSGHFVYESQIDKLFKYANDRADDLWIATYSEALVYYIQWSTATVRANVKDNSSIEVTLNHGEVGDMYNMAMTVRVYVPEGWTGLKLNGEELTVKTDENGKNYVCIDIAPGSTVSLDKLGGASIPDTDEDDDDTGKPIVTPPFPFG